MLKTLLLSTTLSSAFLVLPVSFGPVNLSGSASLSSVQAADIVIEEEATDGSGGTSTDADADDDDEED